MSLYYSSLDKKMRAQADDRAYEQEASGRQIEAQKKLKLEKKLKTINDSILTKLIQKVDEQKSNNEVREERIDFKNVVLDSTVDNLPFDENIVTIESFRNALANETDFLPALARVATAMRVKGKFITNRKFDPKKFLTALNANGFKQGSINNILEDADIKINKPIIEKRRGRPPTKKVKSSGESE